jgi:RHS repeat-associated protein
VRDNEDLFHTTRAVYDPGIFQPGFGGAIRTLPYQEKGRFLVASINAGGQAEWTAFDPATGALTQKTGVDGLATCYTVDGFGVRTSTTERCAADGTGLTTTIHAFETTQDDPRVEKVVTVTHPPNGASTLVFTDDFGRTVETRGRAFNGGFTTTGTAYDPLGRIASRSLPRFMGPTAIYLKTPQYDSLGRMDGETQDLGYIGGATNLAQSVLTTTFQGLTITTEETVAGDPHSHHREETKNALGKVWKVKDANGTETTYGYDADGNLTDTFAPGSHIHVVYDQRGRKQRTEDPDLGTWVYEYDGFGNLKSQTDAKGQPTTMTYDDLGRMRFKNTIEGQSEWVYDVAPGNGVGKLAATVSPADNRLGGECSIPYVQTTGGRRTGRSYAYDSFGQLTTVVECIDGENLTTSFEFDDLGRQKTVHYPSINGTSFAVEYHYTSLGFLWYVSDAADGLAYWQATSFNALGQVTEEYTRNGILTDSDRNPSTGWLMGSVSQAQGDAGKLIQNWSYGYDEAGNLNSRTRDDQVTTASSTETFTYDALDRLKTSEVQVPTLAYDVTSTNDYDVLGNLKLKDGNTYDYTGCGGRPHAVCSNGVTGFQYDPNGSVIYAGSRAFNYDGSNRTYSILDRTTAVNFVYGADGARVVQQVDTPDGPQRTVYVGMGATGKSLYERTYNGSTVEHVQFIYAGEAHGGNALALRLTVQEGASFEDPTMHYYHTDHLGSVTAMTDDLGRVVDSIWGGANGDDATVMGYDPWGARRSPDGRPADPKAFKLQPGHREFTSHETIPLLTLVNMNGRIYDPQLGRFLSADPGVKGVGNLQNFNRYSYVTNNPLRYTDPTGFFSDDSGNNFDPYVNFALGFVAVIACSSGGPVSAAICVGALIVGVIYNAASMRHSGASWSQVLTVAAISVFFDALTWGAGAEAGPWGRIAIGATSAMAQTYFTAVFTGNTNNLGKNMLEAGAEGAAWAAFADLAASPNTQANRSTQDNQDVMTEADIRYLDERNSQAVTVDQATLDKYIQGTNLEGRVTIDESLRAPDDGLPHKLAIIDSSGNVRLSPDAFRSEIRLQATLLHEGIHVAQIGRFNRGSDDWGRGVNEVEAYRAELNALPPSDVAAAENVRLNAMLMLDSYLNGDPELGITALMPTVYGDRVTQWPYNYRVMQSDRCPPETCFLRF